MVHSSHIGFSNTNKLYIISPEIQIWASLLRIKKLYWHATRLHKSGLGKWLIKAEPSLIFTLKMFWASKEYLMFLKSWQFQNYYWCWLHCCLKYEQKMYWPVIIFRLFINYYNFYLNLNQGNGTDIMIFLLF